ncbi:MAG: hypothetical protein HY908_11410 [Myxococcales bacterium]|nr:hypothetical protein [Myxococcales bacterium]
MDRATGAVGGPGQVKDAPSSWALLGAAVYTWASLTTSAEAPGLAADDAELLGALGAALRPALDTLHREARDTEAAAFFGRSLSTEDTLVAVRLLRRRVQGVLGPLAMKLSLHAKEHPAVRELCQEVLATAVGAPIERAQGTALPPLPEEAGEPLPPEARPTEYAAMAPVDRPIATATEVRGAETAARTALSAELDRVRAALAARFADRPDYVASFFVTSTWPPAVPAA